MGTLLSRNRSPSSSSKLSDPRCTSKGRCQEEASRRAASRSTEPAKAAGRPAGRRRGPGCWQRPEAARLSHARRRGTIASRPSSGPVPTSLLPRTTSPKTNPARAGEGPLLAASSWTPRKWGAPAAGRGSQSGVLCRTECAGRVSRPALAKPPLRSCRAKFPGDAAAPSASTCNSTRRTSASTCSALSWPSRSSADSRWATKLVTRLPS